jgi:hypothetical protein
VQVSVSTHHIASSELTTPWSFTVSNASAKGAMPFIVTSDVAWLTVSPGTATSNGPTDPKTITVTPSGAAANETGTITVNAGLAGTKTITVTTYPDYFTQQFTNGVTLAETSLLFDPTTTGGAYASSVDMDVNTFPVDTTGGTVVAFNSTTTFKKVTLPEAFPFYGTNYNDLYINADGTITFGAPSGGATTLGQHFSQTEIALLTSLDAGLGGAVTYIVDSTGIVITFEGVPTTDNPTGSNDVQVELNFDGSIRITYLTLTASGGVVGLSQGTFSGSLPPGFVPSNLLIGFNTGELKALL